MFFGWLLSFVLLPFYLVCSIEREMGVRVSISQLFGSSAGHHHPLPKRTARRRRDTDVKLTLTFLPSGWGLFGNTVYLHWWFLHEYFILVRNPNPNPNVVLSAFATKLSWFKVVFLPRLKKPPDKIFSHIFRPMCRLILLCVIEHESVRHILGCAVLYTVTWTTCVAFTTYLLATKYAWQFRAREHPELEDISVCSDFSSLVDCRVPNPSKCTSVEAPPYLLTFDPSAVPSCFLTDEFSCVGITESSKRSCCVSFMAQVPMSEDHRRQLTSKCLSAVGLSDVDATGIIDTGATSSSVGVRTEFVSFTPSSRETVIDGIASGLKIEGEGIVEYALQLDNKSWFTLRMHAYFVPALGSTRLLAPQSFNTTDGRKGSVLAHCNRLPDGTIDPASFVEIQLREDGENWQNTSPVATKRIPYHKGNNLPVIRLFKPGTGEEKQSVLIASLCVTDDANRNLTDAQKELLKLHFRLGHIGFSLIQHLVRQGFVDCPNREAVANSKIPKCASCEYGKATRRPSRSTTHRPEEDDEMALRKNDLQPGQRVSLDHYESAQPGRTYHSKGSTRSATFTGGLLGVDHASGLIFVEHQVSLSANDTIKAKLTMQKRATEMGVSLQRFHTDEGVFTAREFLEHLAEGNQDIRFSGVGTGHQNGVSERAIRTITSMARTMMLHSALRSPEGFITADLWPMAMDYAVWIYNHVPSATTGLSPLDLFTRVVNPKLKVLNDAHVWGCPTYVLEAKLQKSGVKIPKWMPRSRQAVFLGFSPLHASNVGLVLNRRTGSISHQYHLVFDDLFHTVSSNEAHHIPAWESLLDRPSARLQNMLDDDANPQLADEWLSPDERAARDAANRHAAGTRFRPVVPVEREKDQGQDLPVVQQPQQTPLTSRKAPRPAFGKPFVTRPPVSPPPDDCQGPIVLPSTNTESSVPPPTPRRVTFADNASSATPRPPPTPISPSISSPPAPPPPALRRSSRTPKPRVPFSPDSGAASKWNNKEVKGLCAALTGATCSPADWDEINGLLAAIDDQLTTQDYHPTSMLASAFAAKKKRESDPDSPTFTEAMLSENSEDWKSAMEVEIKRLTERKTWSLMPRSKIGNKPVTPGTWAFKVKRRPDGSFLKFKARYCVRGDVEKRQRAAENDELYAPVVQLSSVRLLLILTAMFGLTSTAIDFTNAFAQADIPADKELFISLPKGFEPAADCQIEHVLKLHRSLYGSSVSPRLWFEKLSAGLEQRGFKASKVDPCVFIRPDCIFCVWVDDALIFARNRSVIDELLQSFIDDGDKYNWEHTEEGSVTEYLGIDFSRLHDGGWKLTQTGLIDKVLKATGMEDCNTDASPTSPDGKALGADLHGPQALLEWNYRSVVGMLLYLAGNSRCDISFAVHQCARFSHAPRLSHEKAIKRICRYLKGTRTEGLIYRPQNNRGLECFPDANFADLFGVESSDDPVCAKSRTGYVVTYAGCPVVWVSKLQTEISLSTQEAELIAMSESMRKLLPVQRLLEELRAFGVPPVLTTVHEDNSAALKVVTEERFSPRTRHMAVKYFWFLSKIYPRGSIRAKKINTEDNLGDIMTKNTKPQKFVQLRFLLCGW